MGSVITVENISKQYTIGEKSSFVTLRDEIGQILKSPFLKRRKKTPDNTFWALKDISFQVEEGEVLGIIGRNGAGKSTLLKILSRITAPTSGRIEMKGRLASLLEVGTGFHPELTGRENILMNGALLGMTHREIRSKLDEIIAFSEIEKFLDTPVKRYSSGMYVRLAFAVAAHLEPEILIVDEVLAVGDIHFQQKCLGKMSEVARGGRTVLFVSHNMSAVERLCGRAILLEGGTIAASGSMDDVIKRYLERSLTNDGAVKLDGVRFAGPLAGHVDFEELAICGSQGSPGSRFRTDDRMNFKIKYSIGKKISALKITVSLYSQGIRLCSIFDKEVGEDIDSGRYVSTIELPADLLRPGMYWIAVGAHEVANPLSWLFAENILPFEIDDVGIDEKIRDNTGIINVHCVGSRLCIEKK